MLSAVSCLVFGATGLGAGFISLAVWVPIVAGFFVHASAPSRFHRNLGLMLPVTLICCLLLCGANLIVDATLEGTTLHDTFVRGFGLFAGAFLVGGAYGLLVTIVYAMFLMRRHELSADIRPLNGNDLNERF